MSSDHLLKLWLLDINVPYLENSRFCSNKDEVNIYLEKVGWTRLIFKCLLDCFWPRLNVHVADDDLLCFETRHREHGRWTLNKSISLNFDHFVSFRRFWSPYQHWIDRWLSFWLLFLFVFFLLLFWWSLFLSFFFFLIFFFKFNRVTIFIVFLYSHLFLLIILLFFFWFRLWLKMSQCLFISVEIVKRCNLVWME